MDRPQEGARRPVVAYPSVGPLAYGAGIGVHVSDELGLGDVVAARQRVEERGRPGHEKQLRPAWTIARFADPFQTLPDGAPSPTAIAAVRRALECADLASALSAARAPLTFGRFVDNLRAAVRLHDARWPADPVAASRELWDRTNAGG